MSLHSSVRSSFRSFGSFLRRHVAGLAFAGLIGVQFAVLAYFCPIQAGLAGDASSGVLKTSPAKLDILDKRECDRHTLA